MTTLNDICNFFPSAVVLDNCCAMMRLDAQAFRNCCQSSTDLHQLTLPISDLHLLIIINRGSLKLIADKQTYEAEACCQIDFTMEIYDCQFIDCSDDLDAMLMAISNEFIFNVFANHPPFSPSYINFKNLHLVTPIERDFSKQLMKCMESIMEDVSDKDNIYREKIVVDEIKILYMRMANYFEKIVIPKEGPMKVKDRQSAIFMQLMMTLHDYAATEHAVAFYANKLCISQQYLGRVCRAITGHSAYEVVSRAVLSEIKRELAHQDLTLQQVTTRLNFSDQAVFTKFFKRQTGITPLQYRKKL